MVPESRLILAACALVLAACTPTRIQDAPAAAAPADPAEQFVAGVRRTVLANGLTVLVHAQPGSGVVAINTWVKAGYFNEPDEVAGMAHLFEHMFFKGSKAYPGPEAIDQAVSGAGGRSNASTIYTYTSYHVVMPKENYVKGIEIQADAIANPLFDPAELRKEAEVVIEESNRKLDNPAPVALERMIATAFTHHRVKRWRIGSNEVLRNIKREDLVAFFETLYRPDNMIVSIAGDVRTDEAIAAATRFFGTIPKGQTRKGRGPAEPPQAEFRFGRSEADIREGYTVFGWHTVPEKHPDEVAVDVLARILGRGRSSRLYRAAVSPTAGSTVSASQFNFDDVGVFTVMASHPEANRPEVERRILAEVERMKREGPTAYELALAKNVGEADFLGQIETALGQAQNLSRYEARGTYREISEELGRLRSVSADQVRDAARKYLTLGNMTLFQHQSRGSPAITREAALERMQKALAFEALPGEDVAIPALGNTLRPAAADSALRTFTLSNGATLAVQQRAGAPLVSTGIYVRGGRNQEGEANAGITRLMLATMRRATATRGAADIDRELEFLGTQLQMPVWEDGFGLAFTTVGRFYEPALDVVADVLLRPTFPDDGIARERALQFGALRRSQDSATERPGQLLRAAMYPGHPYGLPDRGTERSLSGIRRTDLQAWWRASVTADRTLIVVVGNADAQDVRRLMEEKLGAMPRGAQPLAALPPANPPRSIVENVESRERRQTAMMIGFATVPPSHPDWTGLRLLQGVTSGLSGTFFIELRSRQSLAYTVQAIASPTARQGMFFGYLAGEASKEAVARTALLAEFRKLRGEGVREADVARAKAAYAGSTRIGREESSDRVTELGRNYVLSLPLDNVDRTLAAMPALTAQDLRALAARYLSGDAYVYAAVRGSAP